MKQEISAHKDPRSVLAKVFGYSDFRPEQRPVIEKVMAGRDVLALMRTGGGKSLCYQVPALARPGMMLVISPLISLIHDQVEALRRKGVAAGCLHSAMSPADSIEALRKLAAGEFKLFYVAPERLDREDFLDLLAGVPLNGVAVDEAHCVSLWGRDFRLAYTRIAKNLDALAKRTGVRVPRIALTATATEQVRDDVVESLGLVDPARLVASFDRENLTYYVRQTQGKTEALLELLAGHSDEPVLIYTATVKDAERLADLIRHQGIDARCYHGRLSASQKASAQDDFLDNRCRVMVATNAFGMGIDKPDIRAVIHYQMPGNLEAYYQEAGRAGRDGKPCYAYLLYDPADVSLQEFFIQATFPDPQAIHEIYQALLVMGSDGPVVIRPQELAAIPVGLKPRQLEACLRILEDQGAIEIDPVPPIDGHLGINVRGHGTDLDLEYLAERRRAALANLQSMRMFCETTLCRRRYVLRHFGDRSIPAQHDCGGCDRCFENRLARDQRAAALAPINVTRICRLVDALSTPLPSSAIADLLLGLRTASTASHEELPGFGVFRHRARPQVAGWLRLIERDGFIVTGRSNDEVRLTERGRNWLAGRKEAGPSSEPGSEIAAVPTPLVPTDPALRQHLEKVRETLAREFGLAPFMVLTNAMLDALAREQPNDLQGLEAAGITGPRLKRIGGRLLQAIQEFSKESGYPEVPL